MVAKVYSFKFYILDNNLTNLSSGFRFPNNYLWVTILLTHSGVGKYKFFVTAYFYPMNNIVVKYLFQALTFFLVELFKN